MSEPFSPDWELDYYSRPILEPDGKKRWELLICSSPSPFSPGNGFRQVIDCPAGSVNSIWLREALESSLRQSRDQGFGTPRRLRCWRASMRTMVQRAAEGLGLELVPSRRTYALVEWLQQREREVYPTEPGYMVGPLAPPPRGLRPVPVPLPEAARGDRWAWATLPVGLLATAAEWDCGFAELVPLPSGPDGQPLDPESPVPGIRLFSASRSLAIAGWLAGLEPVRLELDGLQLVLEAGLEDRWLLSTLAAEEAEAAAEALDRARSLSQGLQFIAVQATEQQPELAGFWMMRDLPDA
ncbi:MAG: Tab2/Atab2 family RNA-binding protein [Cyanobacteriota bacterium]|nr:Tab2/Atab2 family RNA-binding protein [Cyanobacteriota bacterium]